MEGVFGDDLILYNKIMNAFYDKMNSIDLLSSISCNVEINKIVLKNSRNCSINIINKCFTNSNLSLNILLEAIIENSDFLSVETKKRLEKNLGIVLDKKIDQRNSGFMKRCNVSAEVTNNIIVGTLNIDNCNSDIPLNFEFYNTGDAKANCGMVEVLNSLGKKEVNEDELLTDRYDFILNKVFFLNLKDYFYILIILFFILCIIIFIKKNYLKDIGLYKFKTNLKKFKKTEKKY